MLVYSGKEDSIVNSKEMLRRIITKMTLKLLPVLRNKA